MSDNDTPCITNMLDGIPKSERPWPCRRRGVHYAACENPDECRGCVPRSATHGYLCDVCYDKLLDALGRLKGLITHLRSIDSDGQPMGERVATSMEFSIIVPQSWFAADGLMDALGAAAIPTTATIDDTFRLVDDALAAWNADTETTVNTREGAKRAVVLVRRMQTALHRWPDAEAEFRHIPWVLCPLCAHRDLYRRAPLEYLDDIYVMCATRGCDYTHEWFEWSAIYGPIFADIEDAMKRREREEKRKARSAA